jgi:hypothetical protein
LGFFGCEASTYSQNGIDLATRLGNVVQHPRELLSVLALLDENEVRRALRRLVATPWLLNCS